MAATLVNDLTDLFKSQALGEASLKLGESEGSTLRAFQTSTAAIVEGLASKVGQSGFMHRVLHLINSPLNDAKLLNNMGGFFHAQEAPPTSRELGGKLLSMLFGSDQSEITAGISRTSGIGAASASTLMGYVAPMVLAMLGRRVHDEHMDVSGLSNLVQLEGAGIPGMSPAPLSHPAGTTFRLPAREAPPIEKGDSLIGLWTLLGLLAYIVFRFLSHAH